MPGIAASGAASRIAVAAARQARPASARARGRAPRLPRHAGALARGDRGERVAREDVAQRAEHRDDRGEHPAAGGDRDALPADDALGADREREREERGVGVEHVDRELLAERQPEHARDERRARRASSSSTAITVAGV